MILASHTGKPKRGDIEIPEKYAMDDPAALYRLFGLDVEDI